MQSNNKYNSISLFSGCGGNSLGYKLTDKYNILYANEFIPEAAKTYQTNFPNVKILSDDIRKLTAKSFKDIRNLDLDLMDGSPPCKGFTTAGKREKGWGKSEHYSEGVFQRTDDLYFEYIRLVKEIQPKTFVAENVKGLVSGNSKGYFNMIFRGFKDAGYTIKASVLNAANYGVAQKRERLFYIGIRNDLVKKYNLTITFPKPTVKRYVTFSEALQKYNVKNSEWELKEAYRVPKYILRVLKLIPMGKKGSDVLKTNSYFSLSRTHYNRPALTVTNISANSKNDHIKLGRRGAMCHPVENRYLTISELKAISSFPQDFILTGNFAQQWERIARAVPPLFMKAIADHVARTILDKMK